MGADIASGVSNRVKKPVRRGETGRDAEEIGEGGIEAADGFFVVHEQLGTYQSRARRDRFHGMYLEQ